jgi:hypothetical protein
VTLRVTAPGGAETCTSQVTVLDTTAPSLTAPPSVSLKTCDQPALLGRAVASDACGAVTITNDAPPIFTRNRVTTVTWTATDASGNSVSRTQQVTPSCLSPTLECVRRNSSSSYTALWGYNNTGTGNVTVPVGSNNSLTPNPQNRGQTTKFQRGRVPISSGVTWNGSNLVWRLAGKTSTANKDFKRCP